MTAVVGVSFSMVGGCAIAPRDLSTLVPRLQWGSVSRPPKCQFPQGFHHVNVYPSGTIGNNFLIEECGGWRTGQPTISELLFIIQNHLSHPNPKSPAQAEAYYCYNRSRQDYNAKARELAAMYTKEKFLENALSSGIFDGKLILVDDEAIQDAYDCDSECICSCCTLRLSTEPSHWDERRDMRLLFGIGG